MDRTKYVGPPWQALPNNEAKRPSPGILPLLDDTCRTMHAKADADMDGNFNTRLAEVQARRTESMQEPPPGCVEP